MPTREGLTSAPFWPNASAVPWYVTAGQVVDLFHGAQTRGHGDLEVAVPSALCARATVDTAGVRALVDHLEVVWARCSRPCVTSARPRIWPVTVSRASSPMR